MPTLTFDVTDPLYGATGDGATDDRPAIQAAIAAAVAAATAAGSTRRAVVHFPPGVYALNSYHTGSLANGTWAFIIGDQGGDPISLHFTGSNATLKNTVYQATGSDHRTYRIFEVRPNLKDLRFDGITFLHEAEGVNNYPGGQFKNRTAALHCQGRPPYNIAEDITVTNCEFIDHTWAMRFEYDPVSNPTLEYGEAFNFRRLEFRGNRILGKSNDVTAAVLNGVNAGAGDMAEVIITDNFFDGARTGDVTTSSTKRGAEGFVYLSNPRRCVISNNVIKHASFEAIFLTPTNPAPTGPAASVWEFASAVVANNVIEGIAPVGQVSNLFYGIRVDTPNVVVSGNVLSNIAVNGILLTYLDVSGSHAKRTLCHGNHIHMDGRASSAAIWCNTRDVDITDNYIWFDSYLSPGTAGHLVRGIFSAADGHRITGNRVVALAKNPLGGLETAGVHINNSGQKETIVSGNLFKNLNNAISDFGAGIDVEIYDNEVLDCDVLLASGLSGLDHLWYGKLWCKRQALRFTPTQTGWYRVASTAHGQMSGRLRISSDKEYGGAWNSALMQPMNAEVLVEARKNAAGTVRTKRIIQTGSSNINSGPVTEVRLVTNPTAAHFWWLEVYVASVTAAKEIILDWDTAERGCGLCTPLTQSGTTPEASLILGPGYRYSENNDPLVNGSLMRLGDTGYLWVDSNDKLRMATSTPSQSDETSHGVVVGTQTHP